METPHLIRLVGVYVGPSMEPWSFSHGNMAAAGAWLVHFVRLQWSHGPLAMETQVRIDYGTPEYGPSMEPWSFSHGNSGSTSRDYTRLVFLQWSHGPLAMETGTFSQG